MTQAHSENPVLLIRGLHKHFRSGSEDIPVLEDFNLTLKAGESVALMGPSGSGKSTLLNILSGLESWSSGSIVLFGETMTPSREADWTALRRTAIATVFQEANLMPALTLRENLQLRASLAGRSDPDVDGWLADLGLNGLAQRYPDQVSGGQRQRAALAMAFVMEPGLVLADEPTGSLDRRTADQVADALFRFQKRNHCPLILATHDADLGARCDRTVTPGNQG
ncbi:MAG: ABC transporter ATP-binding protein [Oleiphilaceae bacterium]|nr:ABC transporter ATP-binding protein [Oleiphilaceae bacterium]